jgi:cell wall-associated NlpC family hydrolase
LISEAVSAGDVLFMKGHVMIYLGRNNGVHYAIHSLGSHTIHYSDGRKEKQRIMKIIVSDLSLKTWAGLEHINAFTNSISFR